MLKKLFYFVSSVLLILIFSTNSIYAEDYDADIFSEDYVVREGQILEVNNEDLLIQGEVTVEYGAELILNGESYSTGSFLIEEGGKITINGDFINVGKITLSNKSVMTVNSLFTNNGEIYNYSELTVNKEVLNYLNIYNYSNITNNTNGVINNEGNIEGNGLLINFGMFKNNGSFLSGQILNNNKINNDGLIEIKNNIIRNSGEISNNESGILKLSDGIFYNEDENSVLNNYGLLDIINKASIYNHGIINNYDIFNIKDLENYNKIINKGTFTIYGKLDSTEGTITNYKMLNNAGNMEFTYYSDFIQSEKSVYSGNQYETVYSYGATAIFNGSFGGYIIVAASVCVICVAIFVLSKRNKKNSM